jgi:ubiquinone/menaquinone biosynthesis C-methylase UbiE
MKKPSNLEFSKIFDAAAKEYDQFSNPYTTQKRSLELIKNAKGRMLEVGAGTGLVSSYLDNPKDLIVSDISFEMCKAAKRKLNCPAVCCDAEFLPFKKKFDTIIGSEVIYLMNNPKRFIEEAYRILNSPGNLLISGASEICKFYDTIRTFLRKIGIKRMYFDDKNREFLNLNLTKEFLLQSNFKIRKINKIIILPVQIDDYLSKIFKNTLLKKLGMFTIIIAEKK